MQRLAGIIIRLALIIGGLLTVPVVAQESGQQRGKPACAISRDAR